MTVQFSVAVRNARGNAKEATIGTAAKLEIRSGAPPATCATADSGTLLISYTLASDWAAAFASGAASPWLNNLPLSGAATGGAPTNAGHYRIKDNAGTTCHEQGTITATGGGGDMTLDNISIASGQTVNVSTWAITEAGA